MDQCLPYESRNCANRLHLLSGVDRHNSGICMLSMDPDGGKFQFVGDRDICIPQNHRMQSGVYKNIYTPKISDLRIQGIKTLYTLSKKSNINFCCHERFPHAFGNLRLGSWPPFIF